MLTLKSEEKRCWVASVIKGQECCKINSVSVSTTSMPLPSLFQPSITTEPPLQLIRFVLDLPFCFVFGTSYDMLALFCSSFLFSSTQIFEYLDYCLLLTRKRLQSIQQGQHLNGHCSVGWPMHREWLTRRENHLRSNMDGL